MSSMIRSCSRGSMTYMKGLPSLLEAFRTRVASPPTPAIIPQHSLGRSATAWSTRTCASGAAILIVPVPALPEDPAVERVLDVVDVVGPDAGREVLPAAVAD